jgi:hypothetical protein
VAQRLILDFQVPPQYDRQTISGIVRAICNQVNQLSEGSITARYSASASVPSGSAVSHAVGDFISDSNATVRGSVAPGVAAQYVRTGWVCTVAGSPGTFQEVRVLTGS